MLIGRSLSLFLIHMIARAIFGVSGYIILYMNLCMNEKKQQ